MRNTILIGDNRETLRTLPSQSVHCCVTSPPYWGLRSYYPDGVRIKAGVPPEVAEKIIAELQAIGVVPIVHT